MELKKCPFCGGKAEIAFSGSRYHYWKGYIVARCICCRASVCGGFYQGPPIDEIPLDETIGGEEAACKWNHRNG